MKKLWNWVKNQPLYAIVVLLLFCVILMALGCASLGIPMTPSQHETSNQIGAAIQQTAPILPFPFDLLAAALGGALMDRGGNHVYKKHKARKAAKTAV